jgi:hypothetical protein
MIESSIYYMIKKHLKSDPAYVEYVELFLEVCPLIKSWLSLANCFRMLDYLPN